MKNLHFELYTRYYNATVGRFYTPDQRKKLLTLFAAGFAISPDSEEFETVFNTIRTVDREGIKDLGDSKNYQLICSIMNSEDEVFSAACALAQCFERMSASGATVYSGPIHWRASVCKARGESEECDLENAYIKYCCNMESEAIEILGDLADGGHLLALEHLAIIAYDTGRYEEALFRLMLLEKTIKKELCLDTGSWIKNLKCALVGQLSSDVVEKVAARVKKNARLVAENKAVIGFAIGQG